jgi:hypothetical protein
MLAGNGILYFSPFEWSIFFAKSGWQVSGVWAIQVSYNGYSAVKKRYETRFSRVKNR